MNSWPQLSEMATILHFNFYVMVKVIVMIMVMVMVMVNVIVRVKVMVMGSLIKCLKDHKSLGWLCNVKN